MNDARAERGGSGGRSAPGTMDITIRHTEDCPNVAVAEERVREALRKSGREATIRRQVVRTLAEAEDLGFAGSPTILFDGRDPFADPAAPAALACRTAPPSLEQLEQAIRER